MCLIIEIVPVFFFYKTVRFDKYMMLLVSNRFNKPERKQNECDYNYKLSKMTSTATKKKGISDYYVYDGRSTCNSQKINYPFQLKILNQVCFTQIVNLHDQFYIHYELCKCIIVILANIQHCSLDCLLLICSGVISKNDNQFYIYNVY